MTFFSVAFCVVESSLTFALAMSLRLLLVILRVVDLLIDLTGFQQLLVCADAADLAVVQHDDLVGVADGGGALGDDEHRGLIRQRAQRLAEL